MIEWPAGSVYDTCEGSWVVGSLIFALNDNVKALAHRKQRLDRDCLRNQIKMKKSGAENEVP